MMNEVSANMRWLCRRFPWLAYTKNPKVYRAHAVYLSCGLWFCRVAAVLGGTAFIILATVWIRAMLSHQADWRGWVILVGPFLLTAGCAYGIHAMSLGRDTLGRLLEELETETSVEHHP